MPKSKKQIVKVPTSQELSYPLPPGDLPDGAHSLWHRVCGYLHNEGFDMEVAYPQIFDYCFQEYVYRKNAVEVGSSETPGVEKFSNGNRGVCKNYSAMIEARKRMVDFEKNWGFTPYSVSKITTPDKDDDEEDFIL
jgi:phage terminase small subunit